MNRWQKARKVIQRIKELDRLYLAWDRRYSLMLAAEDDAEYDRWRRQARYWWDRYVALRDTPVSHCYATESADVMN